MRNATAVLVVLALGVCACRAVCEEGAAAPDMAPIKHSDLVQRFDGCEVDWGTQMMYASAEAPLPSAEKVPNRARALLMARDYAKMDAVARLLALIEQTTVTYQGNGKDLMDADKNLRQTIVGYVKNVQIIRVEKTRSGDVDSVRVTVGTKVYGADTPGSAFLDKLAGAEKAMQPPLMELPVEISVRSDIRVLPLPRSAGKPASSRPIDASVEFFAPPSQGPYTSLVVDARGYDIPRAISPKVRKVNGDQVYGILGSKTDPGIREGTVCYAATLESARESDKCGDNPLIVRAIGRGGGKSMCDVVISDKSATQVITENRATGFLDARKVIFVVDPA
jgi:hypothetical protein